MRRRMHAWNHDLDRWRNGIILESDQENRTCPFNRCWRKEERRRCIVGIVESRCTRTSNWNSRAISLTISSYSRSWKAHRKGETERRRVVRDWKTIILVDSIEWTSLIQWNIEDHCGIGSTARRIQRRTHGSNQARIILEKDSRDQGTLG